MQGMTPITLSLTTWSTRNHNPHVQVRSERNQNLLCIPHILSCFDLFTSGLFGKWGFDVGHRSSAKIWMDRAWWGKVEGLGACTTLTKIYFQIECCESLVRLRTIDEAAPRTLESWTLVADRLAELSHAHQIRFSKHS